MKIKYAVLIARTDNLGDNAQTRALYNIYKRMGLNEDEIVFLDIESVGESIEEKVTYIMPCVMVDIHYLWFIEHVTKLGCNGQFRFIPLSIGYSRLYHFNEERLEKIRKPYIDQMIAPIGCRDYDTAELYQNIGYRTYTNGCITNTYPKRVAKLYNQIYMIDVPEGVYQYIPDNIKKNAIVLSQIIDTSIPINEQYELSKAHYDLLRDTASLVITMRYHAAVPCAAMGIPVVLVENYPSAVEWKYDVRLPALNPNIHYYKHEDWERIDWHPEAVDFEDLKQTMIELMISRIKNEVRILKTREKLDAFYSPSRQIFDASDNREYIYFSYFMDDLFLSKIKGDFKYYLFGLSDRYVRQKECLMLDFIKRFYPNADFLGFVDSNKTGKFEGKEIIKPEKMEIDEKTYCLVSAYTANNFVMQLFEKQGFNKEHLWQMPEQLVFYVYCL